MGNICTNNFQKQETTQTVDSKNTVKISVSLGNHCSIDLITENNINYYIAKKYLSNKAEMFYKSAVNKQCPYKKLLLAIMPKYSTEESQEYQQHLRNIFKELLSNSRQITLQLTNTIENITQLPNQMLLAILFKELQEFRSNIKINLISNEKKMMNLYKFQLLKTQNCKLRYHEEGTKEHF